MLIVKIVFDTTSGRLRSGWRVVIFIGVLILPLALFARPRDESSQVAAPFDVGPGMVFNYLMMVIWTLLVSWGCLKFLDREGLASLGLSLRPGWWRRSWQGLAGGVIMVGVVVLVQIASGGSRPGLNPFWWTGSGIDQSALQHTLIETGLTILLLMLAALFEELLYRGYAFQTLLRGVHPIVPLAILSTLFGLSHAGNPNSTPISTLNTILAGIWLSLAYLYARDLWLPTGLHLGWNLALGPILGLPVSGRLIPAHPVVVTSSATPVWLTGGDYGSEAGAAATFVLIVAIIYILRSVGRQTAGTGPGRSDPI